MRRIRASNLLLIALLLGACAGNQESSDNELPVRCVDKPNPGTCNGKLRKFWYDYATNSCRMFYYGGCGGHVPFETREACEALCLAK